MHGTFRPVVDPEVPEKEREVLASHADALTPASLPEPAKTRLADRTAADLVGRVVGGALAGVFPVMSINGWGHAALGPSCRPESSRHGSAACISS